nr:putative defensin Tcis60 [Tityus cisandinus]
MKTMKAIGVLFLISILFCTLEVSTVEANRGCPRNPRICHNYCREIGYRRGICAGPPRHDCLCHR